MPYFHQQRLVNSKGVSIIEILVVITLVGFLVMLISTLPNSIGLIGNSRYLSTAREIAVKTLEDKRALSYINLANTSVAGEDITDSRLKLLPAGSGKVTIKDCDPLICTKGENTKSVTVKLSWKSSNKDQSLTMNTLISEGGLNK